MSDWCLAHPWMTFIVCVLIVDSIRIRINWTRRNRREPPAS